MMAGPFSQALYAAAVQGPAHNTAVPHGPRTDVPPMRQQQTFAPALRGLIAHAAQSKAVQEAFPKGTARPALKAHVAEQLGALSHAHVLSRHMPCCCLHVCCLPAGFTTLQLTCRQASSRAAEHRACSGAGARPCIRSCLREVSRSCRQAP